MASDAKRLFTPLFVTQELLCSFICFVCFCHSQTSLVRHLSNFSAHFSLGLFILLNFGALYVLGTALWDMDNVQKFCWSVACLFILLTVTCTEPELGYVLNSPYFIAQSSTLYLNVNLKEALQRLCRSG